MQGKETDVDPRQVTQDVEMLSQEMEEVDYSLEHKGCLDLGVELEAFAAAAQAQNNFNVNI